MTTYRVEVSDEGDTYWLVNYTWHRVGGPAIEYHNGDTEWYLDGLLHRDDGPAVETTDGYKAWYINGTRHRDDGPAIENPDGEKHWFLNGKEISESELNNRCTAEMTLSQICKLIGKDIKIIKEK